MALIVRKKLAVTIGRLLVLFLVGTIGCVPAQLSPPKASSVAKWPWENSDLSPDPNLTFARLANGFRYVLAKNSHPRQRVSMHLYVAAGSLNESDRQQGLAHLLEHMMFNGTVNFPPGKLVKYFQRIGMQFGPDANARTGFDRTVYDLVLPGGDRESIAEGLKVLLDFAQGALLLDEEINKEKKVVLAEKRTRDSASYRIFKSKLAFEFNGSLVARRLPIGRKETIEKADRQILRQFYDTWYRPENMILVAVGDFDTAEVQGLVRNVFAGLKPRSQGAPAPDPGMVQHQGTKFFYRYEPEAGQTAISIEIVGNLVNYRDCKEVRKQELLRDMAAWIVDQRLKDRLNSGAAYYTDAWMGSYDFLNKYRIAEIAVRCAPGKWKQALEQLEQTLRQAVAFGVTEEELGRAKKQWRATLDEAVKKFPTRKSRQLSREIIADLGRERVILSPVQKRDLLLAFIDAIKVADIGDSLKKMWSADHRLITVTGNLDLGESSKAIGAIKSVWRGSRKVAVKPIKEKKEEVFPYLEFGKPFRAVSRNLINDLGLTRIELANGVVINLKTTDYQADTIEINVIFGNGRVSQPGNLPGLSRLAEEVINESGFGRMDKQALERALTGKTVDFSFQVKEDYFLLTGSASRRDAELLCQLLFTFFKDPGFRTTAYRLAMERFKQRYRKLETSPEGMLLLKGRKFLAGGDSRFGLPPWEKFKTLRLKDLEQWLRPAIEGQDIEVSIVGDMNRDKMAQLAIRYFGALPPRRPPAIAKVKGPLFPAGGRMVVGVDTRIAKALLVVAYPTADFWNIERTRRLSLLSEAFSERLRVEIREKLGLAYSPAAFNRSFRAYRDYGLLQAFIQIAPDKVDQVVTAVQAIADNLREKGISRDELQRAKDPVLTSIRDMRQTNSYWLDSVLTGSSRYPQQLEWSRTIEADYASISVEEINRLAAKYLNNENAAIFVALPRAGKP